MSWALLPRVQNESQILGFGQDPIRYYQWEETGIYANTPSGNKERIELTLYLCPAPPPWQVFELFSANLLFLSLAQPFDKLLAPSLPHSVCMLSFAFLQLFNSMSRAFFNCREQSHGRVLRKTWGKNSTGCPAIPHENYNVPITTEALVGWQQLWGYTVTTLLGVFLPLVLTNLSTLMLCCCSDLTSPFVFSVSFFFEFTNIEGTLFSFHIKRSESVSHSVVSDSLQFLEL